MLKRRIKDYFELGNVAPVALAAGAIVAFVGIFSVLFTDPSEGPVADIRIEPDSGTVTVGETFTVGIVVESVVPTNVFAGELRFDPEVLAVTNINYNTSIAQLWAERPWYSNGDGTLNFAGGTTEPGGFIGSGNLIEITFTTLRSGDGSLAMAEARILQHDGLGSDAELAPSIDALFTVETEVEENTIVAKDALNAEYSVLEEPPSTDLNGDGRQSVADMSIFMLHLASGDLRSDFNQDGRVNTEDMSILLDANN